MADGEREFALLCPHCGEENPPEFPVCWSCQRSLPQDARVDPALTATPRAAAADPEALRRRRKRIGVELAVVLLVLWPPWIIGGIWRLLHPGGETDVVDVLLGLVEAAGIVALISYCGWLDGDWRQRFGLTRPHLGREALWTAIVWILMQVAYTLALLVAAKLGLPSESDLRNEFVGAAVWLAPVQVLVWAFVEELFYRAYIWDRLTELTGRPALSVVITSVLFSAGHVYPAIGTLSTFFIGVALSWIFWSRRSLWSLAVGHALVNLWIYSR